MGAGSGAISGTVWDDITPRPELLWCSLALWSQMTWVQILSHQHWPEGLKDLTLDACFPSTKWGRAGTHSPEAPRDCTSCRAWAPGMGARTPPGGTHAPGGCTPRSAEPGLWSKYKGVYSLCPQYKI